MASAVDICNEALLEVGARTSINAFTDGSPAAFACQTYYDQMRKLLLRTAPWNFCRAQGDLSLLLSLTNGDAVPVPWSYEYLYPPDCVKFRYMIGRPISTVTTGIPVTGDIIFPSAFGASRRQRFLVGQDRDSSNNTRKVILTQACQAVGVWNRDETNVDLFDSGFHEALVALLCYKFVIPLSGNVGMKNSYLGLAKDAVMAARAMDGEESLSTTDHTPDWIAARGLGLGFPYDTLSASQLGYYCEAWNNLNWGD